MQTSHVYIVSGFMVEPNRSSRFCLSAELVFSCLPFFVTTDAVIAALRARGDQFETSETRPRGKARRGSVARQVKASQESNHCRFHCTLSSCSSLSHFVELLSPDIAAATAPCHRPDAPIVVVACH